MLTSLMLPAKVIESCTVTVREWRDVNSKINKLSNTSGRYAIKEAITKIM